MALELKVDTNLSELQKYNISKIMKAGGFGLVVTPDNWKPIFYDLQKLSKGENEYAEL